MGCRQNLLKKYKRGSRTLISWFVSYIAVICVPILLSFFMFSYVGKILSGQIRQMQEDSVFGLLEIENIVVWLNGFQAKYFNQSTGIFAEVQSCLYHFRIIEYHQISCRQVGWK